MKGNRSDVVCVMFKGKRKAPFSVFHRAISRSKQPAIDLPSGVNTIVLTGSVWVNVCNRFPVCKFHIMILLFSSPAAIFVPSGLKVSARTLLFSIGNERRVSRLLVFITLITWLLLMNCAAAMVMPSGWTAMGPSVYIDRLWQGALIRFSS